jgi:hypothetical protein
VMRFFLIEDLFLDSLAVQRLLYCNRLACIKG